MEQDGDLTKSEPVARQVEGETVTGLEVSGKEFKLSHVLKGDEPAFSGLSMAGEPTVVEFRTFLVAEQPGSTPARASFAIKPRIKNQAINQLFKDKIREFFGVEVEDISDIGAEYYLIFVLTDATVISCALESFKTLDKNIQENK